MSWRVCLWFNPAMWMTFVKCVIIFENCSFLLFPVYSIFSYGRWIIKSRLLNLVELKTIIRTRFDEIVVFGILLLFFFCCFFCYSKGHNYRFDLFFFLDIFKCVKWDLWIWRSFTEGWMKWMNGEGVKGNAY